MIGLYITMKYVLVTGKNGYVSNSFRNYMKHFSNYEVDLITTRNSLWKKMNFSKYDAVFNTVGLTHNDARAGTEEQFMKLNSEIVYELAKKSKEDGVQTFINMSSMIVYGNMSGLGRRQVITADTKPNPENSIYGKSKLDGERKIQELDDENFSVAVIRSPLIYGCTATDNIARLIEFSQKAPFFPNLENSISMIYDENLCELVRLIINTNSKGIFYPQMEKTITTSQFVKDLASAAGHRIWITKLFNPILKILSNKIILIEKVFGNQEYDMKLSNAFDGKYRVVTYDESIKRIVNSNEEK